MSRPGLWNIAQDQPELTAIVDTDGRAVSYAELARAANRYGRGLQAMGLRPGDAIVVLLPNSADLLAVHFAALQIGLYVVYANFHLTGAEVAYLIEDSGAKVFVAHQRFSGAAGEAAARSGLPAGACFAVGEIAGFAPLGRLGAGEPGSRPA